VTSAPLLTALVLAAPAPASAPFAPAAPRFWTAAVRFDQAWDSNPLFLPGQPGDRYHSLAARVGHTRVGRRRHLDLTLDGGATLYGQQSALNRTQLAGGLSATERLSPRATLTLREGFAFTDTRQSATLTDAGLLLPQSRTRIFAGSAELACALSPTASLRFHTGHDIVHFSAPGLIGGSTYRAGAGLSRALGPRDSVSASYDAQASRTPGGTVLQHTLTGSWTRVLGRAWSASGSLGGGRFTGVADAARWTGIAGASLTGRFRRDTASASYARSLGQAFGLGRNRVADTISASYARSAGRRLHLSAGTSWVFSHDPADPAFRYRSESYNGDALYRLNRRVDLSAGYAHRRSSGSAPAVTSDVVRLSLSYSWADRRAAGEPRR
jgi:hypothetical protein